MKPGDSPENWATMNGEAMARNVAVPTLTPVLPRAGTANGTAVTVAPRGEFTALSMDDEGLAVARAFARSRARFARYRRLRTQVPAEADARGPCGVRRGDRCGRRPTRGAPGSAGGSRDTPRGTRRRSGAVRLVRSRVAEWGIKPDRVGFVGFSAGAMTAPSVALQSGPDARPDFVVPIYPPMGVVAVPEDAPPLFVAVAADDPLFGDADFGLIQSWQKAKCPVDLHYFERGGHWFGMHVQGTSTDLWFDALIKWMTMHGWVVATAGAQPH